MIPLHVNFDMMLSEKDDDLDIKLPATTIVTEVMMQEITDMHVFDKNMSDTNEELE